MKILFVITGLNMGGAEHVVVNLADALAKRGHKIKITYLTRPALVIPKDSSIELIPIGMTGARSFFMAYSKLRSLVKDFKPDVVHGHMIHANIITRLLRLTTEIPKVISTAHSNNEGGRARMLAYRLTDRLADMSTNVSKGAVKTFEKKKAVPLGQMLAIYNGIDTNYFSFDLSLRNKLREQYNLVDKKVFIAVGRFHKAKDYPNLLNAFNTVIKANPSSHLIIVGEGDLRPQVEQQILDLDLGEQVSLLGIRRDIPALLSAADIFVSTSAWEGFGLAVAEAMAVERLVVATDSGGVAEVVGGAGYLVEPRNSNALSRAMETALLLNDANTKMIGRRARQRIIENYGLDAAAEKWLQLY